MATTTFSGRQAVVAVDMDSGVAYTDAETEVDVFTDNGTPGSWTEYLDDGSDFTILGANPLETPGEAWETIPVWGVVLDGVKHPLSE